MSRLSLEDISNVTFHKASFGGYKPDDVEDFIDDVEATVEELVFENSRLQKEIEEQKKVIERFKAEESSIKSTLLEAKKIATVSIKDAKTKAANMVSKAKTESEGILKSYEEQIKEQKGKLQNTQKEVSEFRSKLLKMYKEHLSLIDALPKENTVDENPTAEQSGSEPEPLQEEAINIDENTSLDDVKKMLSHYPNKFMIEALEDDDSSIYNVNLSRVSEDEDFSEDEIDGLDLMSETKTIKLDAIKFGEDYDLSSDKN